MDKKIGAWAPQKPTPTEQLSNSQPQPRRSCYRELSNSFFKPIKKVSDSEILILILFSMTIISTRGTLSGTGTLYSARDTMN